MKKLLVLIALMLIPNFVLAEDSTKILKPGDSIYAVCEDGVMCPDVPEVSQFSKKHGYQHPHRAEDLKEDCTMCHNMNGFDGITTSRNISCASVDEFIPPGDHIFDTSDAGISFSTTETKVGYLPKGTPVKCGSCHEEVDVYENGRKREYDFEDWRDARLSQLGIKDEDDEEDEEDEEDNGNNPPVDPPTGPVFNCSQVHRSDETCSDCHNDNRTCE